MSVTDVDGEIFLIDRDGNSIIYMDAIGSGVWRALESPQTRAYLEELLVSAFPDERPERVLDELETLLSGMMAEGAISIE